MDEAQQLIDQGYAAHHAGNLQLALELYQAAANALRPLDEPLRLAHTIRHVADIERHLQLLDHTHYAAALAIYRAHPDSGKLDLANTLRPYALLMESQGDHATARELLTEARNLYAALSLQVGVDEASRLLALWPKA